MSVFRSGPKTAIIWTLIIIACTTPKLKLQKSCTKWTITATSRVAGKGGEDKYVIDYVQKTVTAHQSAIDEITRQKEYYVDFLGKVSFEEGDIEAWAFEEKSARTIEDKDGEEIETVQFKYAYQGDRYYVKSLCVDFDKKFFIVRRMTYEIYTDAQKQQVESVHAFIVYEGTDVDDTFFELPDEGEYTFLNEEEEN